MYVWERLVDLAIEIDISASEVEESQEEFSGFESVSRTCVCVQRN